MVIGYPGRSQWASLPIAISAVFGVLALLLTRLPELEGGHGRAVD